MLVIFLIIELWRGPASLSLGCPRNTAEPTGSVQASWGHWRHPYGIAHAKTGAANSKIRKWPEMAAAAIFADRRLTAAHGGWGALRGLRRSGRPADGAVIAVGPSCRPPGPIGGQ